MMTREPTSYLIVLVRLLGAVFGLLGLLWLVWPARAAQLLGMPLLDGLGRSTQVGDFASFFLTLGTTIVAGSLPGRRQWLLFPTLLLAGAAAFRVIAWAVHGADFAASFIFVEIAASILLLVVRRQNANHG